MRRALILICIAALSVSACVARRKEPEQRGPSRQAGKAQEQPSQDDIVLKQLDLEARNQIGLTDAELKADYNVAKEYAAGKGENTYKFKGYRDEFAKALAEAMGRPGVGKDELREIALLLHDDGYRDLALPLVEKARAMMTDRDRYTTEIYEALDASGEKVRRQRKVSRDTYKQFCEILALIEYKFPEDEFGDYYLWELLEYQDWDLKYRALTEGEGRDNFLNKGDYDALMALHDKLSKAGKALRDQDAKDGFAIAARKAFLRFKAENRDISKRAMFSPKMLGREGEKFEDVWGYTYWKPFVVFVEKAPGRDVTELQRSFAATANLLKQEEAWFRKNFIDGFGLKRVLPLDGPTTIVDGPLRGKKFETPGELAEAEGWPLEIIVLKDNQTYLQFLDDQMGSTVPGARGFYSYPLQHVVMWQDPNGAEGSDVEWFNECVMIREAFRMLTDHYAAKPVGWEWKYGERSPKGFRKLEWFPKVNKARLFNLLVQDGLADAVAGFKKEGDGVEATYTFLHGNKVRIPDWQATYKALGNNNLFRIQDLLQCVHYGHIGHVGNAAWKRIGMDKKKGAFPDPNLYFGVYFSDACMASSFFCEYEENGSPKYRDKWLAYLKADYNGAVDRDDYSPEPGIKAFKEAFGITTDDDFDKIEAELVAWAVALKADD